MMATNATHGNHPRQDAHRNSNQRCSISGSPHARMQRIALYRKRRGFGAPVLRPNKLLHNRANSGQILVAHAAATTDLISITYSLIAFRCRRECAHHSPCTPQQPPARLYSQLKAPFQVEEATAFHSLSLAIDFPSWQLHTYGGLAFFSPKCPCQK